MTPPSSPPGRVPFPVIFAAPSGAGKTSIAQALRSRRKDVVFSISATTRAARGYERDGVDYFFRTRDEFGQMIASGELLEWAEVHGQLYGTPRSNVAEAAAAGKHLMLDIDVQGSRQVRRAIPEAISIFILPPSGSELARRLAARASETPGGRRRRLTAAREEIVAAPEFDYVIVNEDLESSVAAVDTILAAEAYRTRAFPGLARLVESLCGEVNQYLAAEPTG